MTMHILYPFFSPKIVFPFFVPVADMKIGRNLARAFLEYYRFTNILPIPPLSEILSKRKGRPKSHRPRRKFKNIYQLRPKTTRAEAPINYTDLSIYYDSDTSAECSSPARYPFHSNFMLQHTRLQKFPQIHDPYSLSQLKLGNLDLTDKDRKKKPKPIAATFVSKNEIISIPPKPYLSIIDFNLLTRGGLEEATSKPGEKVCPHHYQKLRTLKSLDAKSK